LVWGEDVAAFIPEDQLRRLETLVVSDILPNRTSALAHVVLPGCAHAEKRGTFTNFQGRVQRFAKAVEPPGDARPESEVLRELVCAVTGATVPDSLEALFNLMATEVPAFSGLTWAGLGEWGQLAPGKEEHARSH
jgi:predicted molibdopterin-dependent oxidoreductase YjgC